MQNIAVINGRPSLWGDAVLAIVLSSPSCDDVVEYYEGEGDDYSAVCFTKRSITVMTSSPDSQEQALPKEPSV